MAKIRPKDRFYSEYEKPSKRFLNLENSRQGNKVITTPNHLWLDNITVRHLRGRAQRLRNNNLQKYSKATSLYRRKSKKLVTISPRQSIQGLAVAVGK